jgi:hypothetical protein
MQAEDLDVTDLVFEAVGGALCLRGADKRHRTFKSENERCPGASENQIATRNLEHALSPCFLIAHRSPSCGGRCRYSLPQGVAAIPVAIHSQ